MELRKRFGRSIDARFDEGSGICARGKTPKELPIFQEMGLNRAFGDPF
jgi:hypothetical protein